MNNMFSKCSSLKVLNLSNFDTSKVDSTYRMFFGCSRELNLICENDSIKNEYKNQNGIKKYALILD